MKRDAVMESMREMVDAAISRFASYGISATRKEFASDLRLNPVKFERAKYINATLVLRVPETEDEDGAEYRIGVGAEIKHGEVVEADFAESVSDFERRVEEALEALSKSENPRDVIRELDRAAELEYEALAEEIEEKAKKMRPLYIIGALLFIVGMVILFIVATGA